jgi:RNA polymerase sigma-70 factor (ECF subfamily)
LKEDIPLEETVVNLHEEIIARCKDGDRLAFSQLYKLYSKAMYNVAYRIVGNEDDADDALQEGFISAFNNLDSYRGDATFGSWIKRIVINKAINVLKRKKMEPLPDDDRWDVPEEAIDDSYQYNDLTVERVKRSIHQLPDGYRAVLSLYLLEGYDHQEIAEILSVSESTSKSQLNRAKSKLREMLTQNI